MRRRDARELDPHPAGERPARRGLGGEPDVVVAVLALVVGEFVLAVLEIAQVLGGVERRGEPGGDPLEVGADHAVEPAELVVELLDACAAETAPVAAWKIWTRIVIMITRMATVTSISTRVTPRRGDGGLRRTRLADNRFT